MFKIYAAIAAKIMPKRIISAAIYQESKTEQ
jgi:hypothetical protein